jgi:hypothetical protein
LEFNFKGDLKEIERHMDKVQRRAVPKAATRALNKVIGNARTEAIKKIIKHASLTGKVIRPYMGIKKATWGHLVAHLTVSKFTPNLIRFKAIQTKQGVKATPWKKRKLHRGAFIANKNKTVFKRVGKSRTPIVPVFGPSLINEFKRDEVQTAIGIRTLEQWRKVFDYEMQREIDRL